jgi:MerR family transcriptional regulator, thiopeptide resistance regulator
MTDHEDSTRLIGDVARDTGITTRALRHYDQLGLLSPSSRTAGGQRCYSTDDIRRLHRIVALRSFGLSLEEIAATLSTRADDPAELIRHHLVVVDERIERAVRLRSRLLGVLGALDVMDEPSTAQFLHLIEETTSMDEPFSPEKIAELSAAREEAGANMSDEQRADLERRRTEAFAAMGSDERARMEAHRRTMFARAEE